MAAPEVMTGDWIEVNLVGRYHGQTCITTHLYRFESKSVEGAELDLKHVADKFLLEFWTQAAPRYKNNVSSAYSCTAVTAQVISPVRSIMWPASPLPAEAAGGVIGAALPSGVAVVIRRRGNIGDRHNYGRLYLPAVPITYVTDSMINQTGQQQLQQMVLAQVGDITVPGLGGDGTLRPYVLNKTNIPASRVITHGQLDLNVRYQRRREVGVGI